MDIRKKNGHLYTWGLRSSRARNFFPLLHIQTGFFSEHRNQNYIVNIFLSLNRLVIHPNRTSLWTSKLPFWDQLAQCSPPPEIFIYIYVCVCLGPMCWILNYFISCSTIYLLSVHRQYMVVYWLLGLRTPLKKEDRENEKWKHEIMTVNYVV